MKTKTGMVLRKVAGKYIAVPTGEAVKDFSGLVRLNETGCEVWKGIEGGLSVRQIAEKFTTDYAGVTLEAAEQAVQGVIDQLAGAGLVTDV